KISSGSVVAEAYAPVQSSNPQGAKGCGVLYQYREALQQSWAPFVDAAREAAAEYRRTPGDPDAPELRRSVLASYEWFDRLTRRYEKPQFGLTSTVIDGRPVAVQEDVVCERTFCRLLHFQREAEYSSPRILIVPPLAPHFATL